MGGVRGFRHGVLAMLSKCHARGRSSRKTIHKVDRCARVQRGALRESAGSDYSQPLTRITNAQGGGVPLQRWSEVGYFRPRRAAP
ncbi:hypothetical protein HMPREF9238_01151 [Gleimia europaea ACS-120-V-Col10b]|uniref:Uncharacterized protein n=1 Tax=Gleimia europaea ACS-120-V-Col10b TaxID=883069 RepID=A0A9W5RFI5_9ACTO|nr:hypothetical protein HMPREF9238_01151 [Gleimia europaea ACS-120-V-Col10b]